MGIRVLARRPPSEVCMWAKKSADAAATVGESASRIRRAPMAAAVGFVPLRRSGANSTKPPSSRCCDRKKSTIASG